MTESKQDMWGEIQALANRCGIVGAAFDLLEQGMLEDQLNLLMFIVIQQNKQIEQLDKTQENLLKARYHRRELNA
jgi:predicted nucleotidyltransferase